MGEGTAKTAADLFMLSLLGAGLVVGLRTAETTRPRRAIAWLGLLGLASLGSAGAWADYVPLTAVWVLTLLAPIVALRSGRTSARLGLALAAVLSFTLLGTMPLGDLASATWMYPLSLLGATALLATFASAVTLGAAEGERAHRYRLSIRSKVSP